jgi:hypothetical protein
MERRGVNWKDHFRQRRLLMEMSAAQYEFCRLRGHEIDTVWERSGMRMVRCQRCGSMRVIECTVASQEPTSENSSTDTAGLRLVVGQTHGTEDPA